MDQSPDAAAAAGQEVVPDCELLRRAILDLKKHQSELRRARRLSRKIVMQDLAWILHAVETIPGRSGGLSGGAGGLGGGGEPTGLSGADADRAAAS